MKKGLLHHLPDIVRPTTTVCFTVRVPNDPWYLRAWYGTFFQLASARSWDDDADHTALEVARVWLEIALKLHPGCDIVLGGGIELGDEQMLRVNPTNPCELQEFCGGDWVHFWGPEDCAALGGAGQPTSQGGGQPAAGTCQTYDAVIPGNGLWLLPVQVSQGNTIELTDFGGGWTDGSGLWSCLDGRNYALGICGAGQYTSGSDPLPTAYHAAAIALIDGVYYPAYAGVITVPSGVVDANVQIQMNDPSRSDNGGSVNCKVKVCNISPIDTLFSSLNSNTLPVPNPAHIGDAFTWPIDADAGGFFYSDLSLDPPATIEVLFNNQTNTGSSAGVYAYPAGGGPRVMHTQGYTGSLGSVERIIYQTQDQSEGTPIVSMKVVSIP